MTLLLILLVYPLADGATAGTADDRPSNSSGTLYDQVGVFAAYSDVNIRPTGSRGGTGGGREHICVLTDARTKPDAFTTPTQMAVRHPAEGFVYALFCKDLTDPEAEFLYVATIRYDPGNPTAGNFITQADVTAYAMALFQFEAPPVTVAPPEADQVVGVETWLGYPGGAVPDQVVRAAAGPFWAEGTAVGTAVAYDMGDGRPGSVFTCAELAPPFDPALPAEPQRPTCTRYTYGYSSVDGPGGAWPVSATASYEISLVTEDDLTPRLVQTLDGPTAVIPLVVTELQAVIR